SLVATQPLYELRRSLGRGFGQYADAAIGHLAIPHLVADINNAGVQRLYHTTDLSYETYNGDHRGQMTELDPTQLPGRHWQALTQMLERFDVLLVEHIATAGLSELYTTALREVRSE